MADTNKKQLFDLLKAAMKPKGFKWVARGSMFVREYTAGRVEQYQVVVSSARFDYLVVPGAGVRFDAVESIFHQASDVPLADQPQWSTVGCSLKDLAPKAEVCPSIRPGADVAAVVEVLLDGFRRYAQPVYDKFATVADVDREVNADPHVPGLYRSLAWFRAATGTIAAHLVKRPNLNALVATYWAILTTDNNGFYRQYYERLLTVLDLKPPRG